MMSDQPSVWPPVAGRSALRAVGFGLLAAVAVAAAHTVFVVKTEYEVVWVSAILGAVVGLTMRFSNPALHRIWVGVFAAALTLFSLMLSEYLLVRYSDFDSAREDPAQFFFWGLSLLVAAPAAAAKDDDEEKPVPTTSCARAQAGTSRSRSASCAGRRPVSPGSGAAEIV